MNLNLTSHSILVYSTLMCGLQSFAGPLYHLPGNVIAATVGFVYIISLSVLTCSPFIARLVSDNSASLETFELGTPSSPKNFYTGSEFPFVATCDVRFDLPSTICLHPQSRYYYYYYSTLISDLQNESCFDNQ